MIGVLNVAPGVVVHPACHEPLSQAQDSIVTLTWPMVECGRKITSLPTSLNE